VTEATSTRHTNRLAAETSPYLLQHAHNPVDWYPWGPEALARARDLDRPIFLSIGYAACHWCHVMERESFEDEATAADLNDGFVSIKVDREERPDLDAVYMDAVQAMTGQGGWPMSVFLTPEGRPFYGGTYYPNLARYGMPSFRQVLAGVREAWTERRTDVAASATRLSEAIAKGQRAPAVRGASEPSGPIAQGTDRLLRAAVEALDRSFDAREGGWGDAPKFPQPMTIELLLREHLRTGDERARTMAMLTLEAMARGGIRDHLGGGFARYATDRVWLVPHFEKMLYDNAQLARAYLHSWQLSREQQFADVASETLDFMARELRADGGAFTSSLDADTEGEEGATYVWDATQIRSLLGADAELFAAAYGVTDNGNWEGRTILARARSDGDVSSLLGIPEEEVGRRLGEARRRLKDARDKRPQPRRDDKVLASWNGLALSAFAEAARALPDGDRFAQVAVEAAEFLWSTLRDEQGRLRRSWKDGRVGPPGVLEDHTHLAEGLLAVYETTFDERWFEAARSLIDTALEHFADPDGGSWDTADDADELFARPRGLQDNALPSGNAMAATVLLRVAALTGEGRYREAAERTLGPLLAAAAQYPTAFPQWLLAGQLAMARIDEIAIVGEPGAPSTEALIAVTWKGFRPWQVVASAPDAGTSVVPLLADRDRVEGRATAYVCHGLACLRPVTDPAELEAQLAGRVG
jgi:uncharacterized protein YyaL (SSP411 family)